MSILNDPSTRIFCISGELSDVFALNNGWLVNFDELLAIRLRDMGYSGTVFCSTQRNMMYAVDKDGAEAMKAFDVKKPVSRKTENDDYSFLDDEPVKEKKPEKEEKIVYTRQIARDQLSVITDRFMRDKGSRALVFTSLEDLIRLAPTDGGRLLLERFEEWKMLPNENRNICIILSKTLDTHSLQRMLSRTQVAILESLFIVRDRFSGSSNINVGAPLPDEVTNLLEIMRVQGVTYPDSRGVRRTSRLRFHRKDLPQIVRMLSFCSRDSGAVQLKSMKETIERYMRSSGQADVWLTRESIAKLYPSSSRDLRDDTDPMQILRDTKGWESAYNVISSFIVNFRMLYPDAADAGEGHTVERFEPDRNVRRCKVPNFVLEGPPGVGKTAIAGLIGRILQREGIIRSGHTVIGSRGRLVGEYVGQTSRLTAALIEEAQEGVLLVDEVYSLAEKRENGNNSYCDEVFNTIVAAMTNDDMHFCVVFAGYADRMDEVWKMNEGLFSRFGASNVITLNEYEPPLLEEIFKSKFGCPEGISGRVTRLSEEVEKGLPVFFENFFADRDRESFGNARDINSLVTDVKRACSYRSDSRASEMTVEKCDFGGRQSLFDKRGYSAEDVFGKLREYVGMDFLEDMFNDQLSLRVECVEKGLAYPGPSHMIWAGNPGTGKSTAAQLTAELYHSLGILGGASPVYVDASEIMSIYASGSAEKMNEKIDEACRLNTVLIVEEAYQLLERGGTDAIHAMLNRMETDRDKFNLILILYKDKVQDFLDKNPGLSSRLKVYYFEDYTEEQLFDIFMLMCAKSKDTVSDGCAAKVKDHIAELCRSGRASKGNARLIRQLCDSMKQRRYERILGTIAEGMGGDTPENRKRAAAARAMGRVQLPQDVYLFTAEDVG